MERLESLALVVAAGWLWGCGGEVNRGSRADGLGETPAPRLEPSNGSDASSVADASAPRVGASGEPVGNVETPPSPTGPSEPPRPPAPRWAPSTSSACSFSPDLAVETAVGGAAQRMSVAGGYAYVFGDGLEIYDVAAPATPVRVGTVPVFGDGLFVDGDFLYAASTRVSVVDISNRTAPTVLSRFGADTGISVSNVVARYPYAYRFSSAETGGLRVWDLTEPTAPIERGSLVFPRAWTAAIDGAGYVHVARQPDGVLVIDVSDADAPTSVTSYSLPTGVGQIVIDGALALVGSGFEVGVFEISDAATPVLLGSAPLVGWVGGLALAGGYLYAGATDGVHVLSVEASGAMHEVAFYDTPSYVHGVAVVGDYLYAALNEDELRVYRCGG